MDASQEARKAEIEAALKKRGEDEIRGPARVALVHELGGLLGVVEQVATPLTPEKQARADEISARLRDHVAGKPDAFLDVFERRRLSGELADLLGAGEAAPASTETV